MEDGAGARFGVRGALRFQALVSTGPSTAFMALPMVLDPCLARGWWALTPISPPSLQQPGLPKGPWERTAPRLGQSGAIPQNLSLLSGLPEPGAGGHGKCLGC